MAEPLGNSLMKLGMLAKRPSLQMLLNNVEMSFDYDHSFTSASPESYETLLLDVMQDGFESGASTNSATWAGMHKI